MPVVRLSELEIGQCGETMFYVVECAHRVAKTQQIYAELTVCDSSARRRALKWELSETEAGVLCRGAVVHALVLAGKPWKSSAGDPELTIRRFQPVADADPRHFLPPRGADSRVDWRRFGALVTSVTQPDLLRLLRRLFQDKDLRVAFHNAPAAQHKHHPYPGGLLEHSVEVAELALDACRRLGGLDRDLVLTGALLHDIGKIREMECDMPGYPFTESGGLVGHVILGADMVREAVQGLPGFDPRLSQALQHLILSHHGRKEWGAPVEPATPEALLLHSCDQISVQMFFCRDAARSVSDAPFQWVSALDRRMYLSPNAASPPAPPDEQEQPDANWWEEARPEIRIVAGGLAEAEAPQMAAFPIYGSIAAGSAIRAEQNLEGYLALPLTGHGDEGDFLLRVTGDSMRDAHILDGDIVRVRPRVAESREGDIVAALVNGDATVKRFHRNGGSVLLKAENPDYPDIPIGAADDFSVQGIVVGLLRERMA